MPSYRSFVQHPPWRRLVVASTAARLPMTMAIFGLVLAGRALGSFALGGRLAALYTLTGAATAVWRGRRMDRGDLRVGLRRDGLLVAVLAGGIAATIAVILIPGILILLPSPWNGRIGRFTLLEAAQQVSALHPAADLFSPGWSLLVLLAWPAAGLAAAAVVITRRDA